MCFAQKYSFSSPCIFNQFQFTPYCNIEPVEYFTSTLRLVALQRVLLPSNLARYIKLSLYLMKVRTKEKIFKLPFNKVIIKKQNIFSEPECEFKLSILYISKPFCKMDSLYEIRAQIIKSQCKVLGENSFKSPHSSKN